MNRLSYVENFVLTTPESHYMISSAVPEEFVKQWIGSIKRLKDGGLFSSLEFCVFEQARNVPIRSEHYDFDSGTWDFEWSASPKVYPEIIKQPSFKAKFDKTDLEIIKRLQLDASKSLVEIQKETGANYKTLGFHHRTHVIGRDLFEGYKVDWIGARYNRMEKRAEHRRHRYQLVDVMVRDISESRRLELMGMTNALPFLCWEAWGESYYAKMAFPMESLVEAMQFLTKLFSNVKDKARWFLIDQSHSVTFTIVPELYDESTNRWKFNQEEMLRKFERLMLQIKEGGSRVPKAPSSRNHPSVDRG
jgi:hypothetical protein